uniref:Uncharacterized protein n=1 Tax=Zea mays TaxID=4577 RepID=A0A804MZI1_MAIZE
MASLPPGPPAWSVTLSLRHRGGLEIRAAAENLLPGWGRGGERMSLLLRLRRCLLLSVTSNCGGRPAATTQPGPPPRGSRVVRFLRSRWARLPRATSIWRRKKQPPARAAVPPDCRDQTFWLLACLPAAESNAGAACLLGNGIDASGDDAVRRRRRRRRPCRDRVYRHGVPHHGRHQQPERRLRQQTDCAMGQVVGVAGASPSQLQLQVSPWCAKARAGVDLQQVDVLSDESHLRCVGARKGSI